MMHRDHTLKMSPKKERVYEGRFRHVGGSDSIKCNTFNIIMLPMICNETSFWFTHCFFNFTFSFCIVIVINIRNNMKINIIIVL